MPAVPSLSVEHTESKEEKSTQCFDGLQQTTTETQSTPTDLIPPSGNFLSTPGDHHNMYSFLGTNKQHLHFNKQRLNERQQKNTNQRNTICRRNLFVATDRSITKFFIAANGPSINS